MTALSALAFLLPELNLRELSIPEKASEILPFMWVKNNDTDGFLVKRLIASKESLSKFDVFRSIKQADKTMSLACVSGYGQRQTWFSQEDQ